MSDAAASTPTQTPFPLGDSPLPATGKDVSVFEVRTDHPVLQWLFLQALPSLHALQLPVRFQLRGQSDPALWVGREHAIALCIQPDTQRSPLSVCLGRLALLPYIAPYMLAGHEPPHSLPALLDLRQIDIAFARAPTQWQVQAKGHTVHVRRPDDVEDADDVIDATHAALVGRGIAWLPAAAARDELRRDGLVLASPRWCRQTPLIHLCIPHRRTACQVTVSIIDAISEVLSRPHRVAPSLEQEGGA